MDNNIIDSLIYTKIRNNLKKSNYKNYDNLLRKLNTSDDKLDDILNLTTIKKGCCNAIDDEQNNNNVEVEVHILDPSGQKPYIKKKVSFDKTIFFSMFFFVDSNWLKSTGNGSKYKNKAKNNQYD